MKTDIVDRVTADTYDTQKFDTLPNDNKKELLQYEERLNTWQSKIEHMKAGLNRFDTNSVEMLN